MFARVVVGSDGSSRDGAAAAVGRRTAAAFGCPVEVVHVPTPDDDATSAAHGAILLEPGDPADGLIGRARETEPEGLLCLASRGRSAVGDAVFGSVTTQVVRGLGAPLLIVGPKVEATSGPLRRMLVCLDGSDTALSIVPVARDWASRLGLELELLHVSYPLPDGLPGQPHFSPEDLAAAEQLREVASGLSGHGIAVRTAVRDGTWAAERIAELAAPGRFDVVALATHGRTGLARVLAGSVMMDVVRHAGVPVLTVRPPGLH
jgi:nucleotide-binding universal stress UspA family protein